MNYFELFGIKEAPVADKAELARKYFELQKKFHPDFYTNENEAEQENATMQSAEINKAFNIFRNPEKTLEYYLQLKGVITTEEKFHLPPDFLMEMMELNETFEEKDISLSQNKVADYEKKLDLEILFLSDSDVYTDTEMQQMKAYFYKKKYLKRILERLDD